MRKRLIGAIASTMIVFAACQGAASPSPSGPAASVPTCGFGGSECLRPCAERLGRHG